MITTNYTKAEAQLFSSKTNQLPTDMGTLQTFLLYQMVLVSPLLNKSLRNQHNSSNLFFDLKKKKKKNKQNFIPAQRGATSEITWKTAFVMNLYHWWHSATMAIGGRTTLWSGQTQKKDCETRTQRQTNRVTCQKKKNHEDGEYGFHLQNFSTLTRQ